MTQSGPPEKAHAQETGSQHATSSRRAGLHIYLSLSIYVYVCIYIYIYIGRRISDAARLGLRRRLLDHPRGHLGTTKARLAHSRVYLFEKRTASGGNTHFVSSVSEACRVEAVRTAICWPTKLVWFAKDSWMQTGFGPAETGPALPCPAMPCPALPCRAMPCRAVPCSAVQCRAVPCRAVPCRAVPCRALTTPHLTYPFLTTDLICQALPGPALPCPTMT